jgi:DNA-binding NarL/FixJ family response regulator
MTSGIRVLVTGDAALMREGIHSLLEAYEDIEVIGEAANGKQSVEKTRDLEPDVVLIDMTMQVMNGFEATRRLSRKTPKTKVIILTDRDTEDSVVGAIVAGACGCIRKTATGADLVSAIKAVHAGQWYLHPSLTKTLVQAYISSRRIAAPGDPYEQLTDRERQVLRLLVEGRKGWEVAQDLGLAVKTAAGHTVNIMRKLGIHNRGELIKYAIRRGIIDLKP